MYIPHGDDVVVSSNMAWYQFVHLWSGEAMHDLWGHSYAAIQPGHLTTWMTTLSPRFYQIRNIIESESDQIRIRIRIQVCHILIWRKTRLSLTRQVCFLPRTSYEGRQCLYSFTAYRHLSVCPGGGGGVSESLIPPFPSPTCSQGVPQSGM